MDKRMRGSAPIQDQGVDDEGRPPEAVYSTPRRAR